MHGTIDLVQDPKQEAARERAYSIPLEQFNPGDPELFRSDTSGPISTGCAGKTPCITAGTACSGRTGR